MTQDLTVYLVFIVYAMGIPVLRTLAFAVGFLAQVALVLAIFGKL